MKRLLIALAVAALLICGAIPALASQFDNSGSSTCMRC